MDRYTSQCLCDLMLEDNGEMKQIMGPSRRSLVESAKRLAEQRDGKSGWCVTVFEGSEIVYQDSSRLRLLGKAPVMRASAWARNTPKKSKPKL